MNRFPAVERTLFDEGLIQGAADVVIVGFSHEQVELLKKHAKELSEDDHRELIRRFIDEALERLKKRHLANIKKTKPKRRKL